MRFYFLFILLSKSLVFCRDTKAAAFGMLKKSIPNKKSNPATGSQDCSAVNAVERHLREEGCMF